MNENKQKSMVIVQSKTHTQEKRHIKHSKFNSSNLHSRKTQISTKHKIDMMNRPTG